MVRYESRVEKVDLHGGGGKIFEQILTGPREGHPGFLREFTRASGELHFLCLVPQHGDSAP